MRRYLTVGGVLLLLLAVTVPVLAWEFDMKGDYEYRMRYFGRTGGTDLFGIASLQDNGADTFIGFAGPNIYGTGNVAPRVSDTSSQDWTPNQTHSGRGMVITRGGFSRWGSDAFYNDSRLTFRPSIKVNQAIRLNAVYNIGGMRNKYRQATPDNHGSDIGAAPLERYYMSQTSMNAYDGVFGTWEQFRLTATMPWAIWSMGMKDFPFGTGATLANNTRAEEFLWVVPYGPFRLLWATWLSRGRLMESWSTVPDSTTKNSLFQGLAVAYDSGEISAGVLTIWRQFHQTAGTVPGGPDGDTGPSYRPSYGWFNPGARSTTPFDENTLVNLLYFKFNNGRFFANAEYSWFNVNRTFPVASNTFALGAPLYLEGNHFFAEAGAIAGPAKLSLMYALASGSVLDNALPLLTSGVHRSNPTKIYTPYPINYQAMEPYEFLMFNTYAGGNNGGWNGVGAVGSWIHGPDVTFVADEHGMMTDAYCFAGRLDYAVAANLNLFGSYIWAHRLERAGFLNGGIEDTGDGRSHHGRRVDPGEFLTRYGGTTPYCPDGFLGWEMNLGFDWKLLEGLTFKTRYSYWKPGQWFDYAYQAWGVNQAGAIHDGVVVKNRDAINAFQASVLVEF